MHSQEQIDGLPLLPVSANASRRLSKLQQFYCSEDRNECSVLLGSLKPGRKCKLTQNTMHVVGSRFESVQNLHKEKRTPH